MTRYGMAIDVDHCCGCHACAFACKAEHGTPSGVWWSKVLPKEKGKYPTVKLYFLPVLCMQCSNAPCVHVCPTNASHVRKDGIVDMDYSACMGCKYCEAVCPYGARTFIEEIKPYYPEHGFTPYELHMNKYHLKGTVEKCNFCAERIDKGEVPACVDACPATARFFGDLDDPNSELMYQIARRNGQPLAGELGTQPKVFYLY